MLEIGCEQSLFPLRDSRITEKNYLQGGKEQACDLLLVYWARKRARDYRPQLQLNYVILLWCKIPIGFFLAHYTCLPCFHMAGNVCDPSHVLFARLSLCRLRGTAIGVRGPSALGGSDLLARKNCTIPGCISVKIGIQMHSNCMRNKSIYNSHV